MIVKKRYFAVLFIALIMLCIFYALHLDFTFCLVFVLWTTLFVLGLMDVKRNSIFCGFLLCFFAFLMGRQTLEYFGLHRIEVSFSPDIERQTNYMLLTALIGLALGYVLVGRIQSGRQPKEDIVHIDERKTGCYLMISKWLFFISYPVALLPVIESALFVQSQGYFALYLNYASHLPGIVQRIATMNGVFFCIFLGCFPDRKEIRVPLVLRVVYLGLTLFTGRRFQCIGGLLVLVVYFLMRKDPTTQKSWIDRKKMLWITAGVFTVVILSNLLTITRAGGQASVGIKGALTEFLYQQGVSISVIKRYIEYKDYLPKGKLYFAGSTLNSIARSIPGRVLLGMKTYGGNSVATAQDGYSFAHALSYVIMPEGYLRGEGMGSCYIAELHYSLGNIGVFLGSFFYGGLFRKMFILREGSIWRNALVLVMLNAIFFAARGEFDGWISELFSSNTWGALLLTWVLAQTIIGTRRVMRKD